MDVRDVVIFLAILLGGCAVSEPCNPLSHSGNLINPPVLKQETEIENKQEAPFEITEAQKEQRRQTIEQLQRELIQVLGKSNRGIARTYKIQDENGNIKIGFTVNDNITKGFVRFGAKSDIEKILKATESLAGKYSEVIVIGTFSLTDKFGNSKESRVIEATYTRNTINKINWQGFLIDDIYAIADSVWLHPDFKER